MSNFEEPVRAYKFSDSRLVQVCTEIIAFARRDATELATVGITATWVNDLETAKNTFALLPTDEVELGEQEAATEEKDEDAEAVREVLRDLRTAAHRAFGVHSGNYKKFGLKDLDDFTDDKLVSKAQINQGVATTHAAELAAKGFDASAIASLGTLAAALVDSMTNKALEVGSRDTAQETRVVAGNALYKMLEDELCFAAKNYWRTRSAAKYNDYIIHHTEHEQVDNGTILHNSILEPEVTVNSASDFITLAIPAGGQTLKIYCSANEGDSPTGLAVTVINGSTWSGRAEDIGWTSVNRRLLLSNETDSDSAFTVTVV